MKRTTLFIDEAMEHEIHALARRQGVPVSHVMRESFARYLQQQRSGRGLELRFLGRGHSGQKDVAQRHEELLWRDLNPHGGPQGSKGRRRRRD